MHGSWYTLPFGFLLVSRARRRFLYLIRVLRATCARTIKRARIKSNRACLLSSTLPNNRRYDLSRIAKPSHAGKKDLPRSRRVASSRRDATHLSFTSHDLARSNDARFSSSQYALVVTSNALIRWLAPRVIRNNVESVARSRDNLLSREPNKVEFFFAQTIQQRQKLSRTSDDLSKSSSRESFAVSSILCPLKHPFSLWSIYKTDTNYPSKILILQL